MHLAPGFRIGVNGLPSSVVDLRREVGRYEELGFDFVAEGDHLGGASPFGVLSAAALVSERLRLRTYVLNACFCNPALFAREVATLDRLSGGRFELGVGAGTDKSEFDEAGIRWRPAEDRVAVMAQTIKRTRWCLNAAGDTAQAVQEPVPVLVGAMSRASVAVAAEHADIVAFSGLPATNAGIHRER